MWIVDNLGPVIARYDEFSKTLLLDGAIIVSGVPGIDKERHQITSLACIDGPVRPAWGYVEHLTWPEFFDSPVAFRRLHNHHSFAVQTVIDLGGF